MNTAYFENISSHIKKELDRAEEDVKIAMAWFTSNELFQSLKSCLKRGVNVSIVIFDDPINWAPYAPDFNELITLGAKFKISSREQGLMHHKFCIIDKSILINGSYNWTYYAETRNAENVVFSDEPELIQAFTGEYEKLLTTLPIAQKAPQLSWDDITSLPSFDFTDLNYESKRASYILSKPQVQLAKCGSIVEVRHPEKLACLKYDIGFHEDNGDKSEFTTLIKSTTKLPYEYTDEFDCPKRNREFTELRLASSYDTNAEFVKIPLRSIVLPRINDENNLTVSVSIKISDNGNVYIQVRCKETNLKTEQTCQIPSLINFL